jgi:hypothetical protein
VSNVCHLRVVILVPGGPNVVGRRGITLGYEPQEGRYIRGISAAKYGERVAFVALDAKDPDYLEAMIYSPFPVGTPIAQAKEHFGPAWEWSEQAEPVPHA